MLLDEEESGGGFAVEPLIFLARCHHEILASLKGSKSMDYRNLVP